MSGQGGDAGAGGRRGRRSDATLRPMTYGDLASVLEIERDLFPEDAWSESMFHAELSHEATRYYLVADDAGEMVGYAGLFAEGSVGDVQTVAVRPGHWGRGIGRGMLAALLAEAARRGCREIYLEVRADNERAQRLYRRFGFEQVGIRPGYYQQVDADAIVMRRVLSPAAKDAPTGGGSYGGEGAR